jgi:glycerate dehydrogenase
MARRNILMKIVILDGYALNPGDLSWGELEKIGDVKIYDRTPVELIKERAEGAQIILTNKTPIGEKDFAVLPDLKYVGVLATGYNVVDVEAALLRNIIVTNIPAYSTMSVAQMTFSLLLELCLHVQKHSDSIHNGDWVNCKDFCYWNYPLVELNGKTL